MQQGVTRLTGDTTFIAFKRLEMQNCSQAQYRAPRLILLHSMVYSFSTKENSILV